LINYSLRKTPKAPLYIIAKVWFPRNLSVLAASAICEDSHGAYSLIVRIFREDLLGHVWKERKGMLKTCYQFLRSISFPGKAFAGALIMNAEEFY
jgi:hypothetical protein